MPQTKYLLDESDIPTHWYNVVADMPNPPAPPLGPDGKPIGPGSDGGDLPDKPDRAGDVGTALDSHSRTGARGLSMWRPSPLIRAHRLEAALGTPARIYYKNEGVSPAGSHKLNTAVPQAYYNKQAGIKRIATETGAGQWGSVDGVGRADVRDRSARLHGASQLRAEAVPPLDDADLGRRGVRQPEHGDQNRPRHPGRGSRTIRARWASRSPRRWKRPPRAPTPTTRWARCSTMCCCTRPSSAWKPRNSSRRPATIRTWFSRPAAAAPTSAASHFLSSPTRPAGKNVRLVAVEPTSCPTLTKGSLRLRLTATPPASRR